MPWPDPGDDGDFPVQNADEGSDPRRLTRLSPTVTVAERPDNSAENGLDRGRSRTRPRIDTDTDVIYGECPSGPAAGAAPRPPDTRGALHGAAAGPSSNGAARGRDIATGTTATGDGTNITGRPTALRSIDLETFFRPKRVAVVGASDANARPNTALTQKITVWAEEQGATVYFVNPNRPTSPDGPARGARRHRGATGPRSDPRRGTAAHPTRRHHGPGQVRRRVSRRGSPRSGPRARDCQDEMERIIASGDSTCSAPIPT